MEVVNSHQLGPLDFIAKMLQADLRPYIDQYVKDRTLAAPVVVEFDPTTACNFQCPECISLNLLNKGEFSPQRTREMLNDFHRAGVRGVIFIGGGEPLAHTGMPDPIAHAKALGMAVGLTTNGTLIGKYLNVIAECVSWTRVSVDAASQATFSSFRPSRMPDSFHRVLTNIELLAKAKTGLLGYSFLVMERVNDAGMVTTNAHEIVKAALLARDTGCDYFELKPMVDEHHNLIQLSDYTRNLVLAAIGQIADIETENFRIVYPKSMSHVMISAETDQPKRYTSCPTIEMRTVVTPSGIYPCPYKRGHSENKLGSAHLSFAEFWPSAERKDRTHRIDPSRDCPFYCIRHESNLLLTALANLFHDGVDALSYLISVSDLGAADIFL